MCHPGGLRHQWPEKPFAGSRPSVGGSSPRAAPALARPRGWLACPFYRIVSPRGQEAGKGFLRFLGVSEVCGLFCSVSSF